MQFTTGAETIFPGIHRVLPGETLTCADGRVLERRRMAALPEGGPEDIDEDTALTRLDRALTESVDLHQRSDVPYGMFLSGGIDSATLLTLMARLNSAPVLRLHRRIRPSRRRRRARIGAHRRQVARREARDDRDHVGRWCGGICRKSSLAWMIRRPTTPSSRPGSSPAVRRQDVEGRAVRRRRRRDFRRLRPLSQRDAAVVARAAA